MAGAFHLIPSKPRGTEPYELSVVMSRLNTLFSKWFKRAAIRPHSARDAVKESSKFAKGEQPSPMVCDVDANELREKLLSAVSDVKAQTHQGQTRRRRKD